MKNRTTNKKEQRQQGALSSLTTKLTRANSTNHPNRPKDNPTKQDILKQEEWCYYSNLPSPKAYMD